jgi:mono/diheme cytochrome c family protein
MQPEATPLLLSIAITLMSTAAAQAAQVGSVQEGLSIARERCSACHLVVKEKGLSTNEKAPTFARIASIPGMTATALRVALSSSHETMPNLILKDEEADSLIAYILSLKENH